MKDTCEVQLRIIAGACEFTGWFGRKFYRGSVMLIAQNGRQQIFSREKFKNRDAALKNAMEHASRLNGTILKQAQSLGAKAMSEVRTLTEQELTELKSPG